MSFHVRLAGLLTAAVVALGAPVPAGARPPAAGPRVLALGSHGTAVRVLQRRLGLPADGDFGRRTARAVRRFQRRHGLRPTGRLDRPTRAALRRAVTSPADGQTGGTPASEPAPGSVLAAPGTGAAGLLAVARTALGRPYRRAAAGPGAFDCSGLVVWAATAVGLHLPRSSFQQFRAGVAVPRTAIRAGDLVFFDTAGTGASDVGIASGPATAISATTHGVREHTIFGDYWGAHFVGARRVG